MGFSRQEYWSGLPFAATVGLISTTLFHVFYLLCFIKKIFLSYYLFLAVLDLRCCSGFSLVAVSGG